MTARLARARASCGSEAGACALRPSFFFFNDTATTEIYTLSLHDALPISPRVPADSSGARGWAMEPQDVGRAGELLQSGPSLEAWAGRGWRTRASPSAWVSVG